MQVISEFFSFVKKQPKWTNKEVLVGEKEEGSIGPGAGRVKRKWHLHWSYRAQPGGKTGVCIVGTAHAQMDRARCVGSDEEGTLAGAGGHRGAHGERGWGWLWGGRRTASLSGGHRSVGLPPAPPPHTHQQTCLASKAP